MESLFFGWNWDTQQNNDPKHTSESTAEWLKNKIIKVLSLQHLDYFWFFFLLRNVVLKTTESWGVHFHMTVNSSTWLIQRSEGFFTLNTHTDIWLVVLSLLGFFPPSLKVFLAAWFHFSVQLRRNETDNTLDSVLLIITQLWSNKVLF